MSVLKFGTMEDDLLSYLIRYPQRSIYSLSKEFKVSRRKLKEVALRHGLRGFKRMDEESKRIFLQLASERNLQGIEEFTRKGFLYDKEVLKLSSKLPEECLHGVWKVFRYIHSQDDCSHLFDSFLEQEKLAYYYMLFHPLASKLYRNKEYERIVKLYEDNQETLWKLPLYYVSGFFVYLLDSLYYLNVHSSAVIERFFRKLSSERYVAHEKFFVMEHALLILSRFIWNRESYKHARSFLEGFLEDENISSEYKVLYYLSLLEKHGDFEGFKRYRKFMTEENVLSWEDDLRSVILLKASFLELLLGNEALSNYYLDILSRYNEGLNRRAELLFKMYYYALRGDSRYRLYLKKLAVSRYFHMLYEGRYIPLENKLRDRFFRYFFRGKLNRAIDMIRKNKVMFFNLIDAVIFLNKPFVSLSKFEEVRNIIKYLRKVEPKIYFLRKHPYILVERRKIYLGRSRKLDGIFLRMLALGYARLKQETLRKLKSRFGDIFVEFGKDTYSISARISTDISSCRDALRFMKLLSNRNYLKGIYCRRYLRMIAMKKLNELCKDERPLYF